MEQLTNDIYFLEGGPGAIVQFASATPGRDKFDEGDVQTVATLVGETDVQFWGKNNDLPLIREKLVAENNIIGPLIQTKRDITIGSDLLFYRERFEDGKPVRDYIEPPDQIADWLDRTDFLDYIMMAAADFLFHVNVFTELIPTKDRTKIHSIHCKRCRHVRAGKRDNSGRIPAFYWSGNWASAEKEQFKPKPIAAWTGSLANKREKSFVLHTGDPLLTNDDYYFTPSWWGGAEWIALANCIPRFHLANLRHGYSPRFHVQIPKDYFRAKSSKDQAGAVVDPVVTEQKTTAARKKFLEDLNDFLAGLDNTGRAVVSSYDFDRRTGNAYPGIKIEPIKFDLNDKALLDLFDKSNAANISSQAIHPVLANIETQGKLSSGSEIRNAFLIYVATKTPLPRRILLQPLRLVQKVNGWDPTIRFGFRDIEIRTLDEDKKGARAVDANG